MNKYEKLEYFYTLDENLFYTLDENFDVKAIGKVFKTEKEAREHIRYIKIRAKIVDIANRLGRASKEDMQNPYIAKYCSYYDCNCDGTIFCLSENFPDVCNKEIGKEDLIFYSKYQV